MMHLKLPAIINSLRNAHIRPEQLDISIYSPDFDALCRYCDVPEDQIKHLYHCLFHGANIYRADEAEIRISISNDDLT